MTTSGEQPLPPARGQVWLVESGEARGNEPAKRRPFLIVSDDRLNRSGARLCVGVPLTSTLRPEVPTHVRIDPPEGGLTRPSDIMVEHVRAFSHVQLLARCGSVSPLTMSRVESLLRRILVL